MLKELKTLVRDLHFTLNEIRAAARRRDRFIRVTTENGATLLIPTKKIERIQRTTIRVNGEERYGTSIRFADPSPLCVIESVEVIEAMLA
jgi:hypothetical protein